MAHQPGSRPVFSRRQFFQGVGATAAGATVAATLPAGTQPPASRAQAAAPVQIGPRPGPPGSILIQLVVNSTLYEIPVDPRLTLAELLRDELGLTGTKVGCDRGECGTCTVLLDDRPVLSCLTLAADAANREVLTVEGLATGGTLHPIQQAFLDHHGLACGFCTPGMMLSAKALLDKNHGPSRDEIRAALSGNLCRCTGYTKIIESVEAAAKLL